MWRQIGNISPGIKFSKRLEHQLTVHTGLISWNNSALRVNARLFTPRHTIVPHRQTLEPRAEEPRRNCGGLVKLRPRRVMPSPPTMPHALGAKCRNDVLLGGVTAAMLSPSESFLARPRLMSIVGLIKRHAGFVRAARARIDDEADAGCSTSPRANCCPIRRTTSLPGIPTCDYHPNQGETKPSTTSASPTRRTGCWPHDLTDILDQRDRDYCIAVL